MLESGAEPSWRGDNDRHHAPPPPPCLAIPSRISSSFVSRYRELVGGGGEQRTQADDRLLSRELMMMAMITPNDAVCCGLVDGMAWPGLGCFVAAANKIEMN